MTTITGHQCHHGSEIGQIRRYEPDRTVNRGGGTGGWESQGNDHPHETRHLAGYRPNTIVPWMVVVVITNAHMDWIAATAATTNTA